MLSTQGFHGHGIHWSPFRSDRIACATSANFAIAGSGRLFTWDGVNHHPTTIKSNISRSFGTKDAMLDCAWTEWDADAVLTAGASGSIRLFSLATKSNIAVRSWSEHQKEVSSIACSIFGNPHFLSSSWDASVKLWDVNRSSSIATFPHHHQVTSVSWSPHVPTLFASTSADGVISIFDTSASASSSPPFTVLHSHLNMEITSIDWMKYDQNMLATSSTDRCIYLWDKRNTSSPVMELRGHELAVRKVKCSPHFASVLASVGYDMTLRIWDIQKGVTAVEVVDDYNEFVVGLDWNLHVPGQLATCSWDETVRVISPNYLRNKM